MKSALIILKKNPGALHILGNPIKVILVLKDNNELDFKFTLLKKRHFRFTFIPFKYFSRF